MDTSVADVTVRFVEPDMLPNVAVITAVPTATEDALPLVPATVATDVAEELHVAEAVKSCVVLSENVPVAVNCCVVPRAMLELAGVTAIDTSVAEVTVSVVEPVIPLNAAVMVVVPGDTDAAFPLEPAALLIVATDVAEDHVTDAVRSCVVLSEKVPVAVNCWVVPTAILGFVGVTAMDTSVEEVTDRVVEPDIVPEAAVIVAAPTANAVTFPAEPDALLTEATVAADELHVTDAVISCVLLSEKVPVAVNCWDVPMAMAALVGVTAMDTSVFDNKEPPPPPPQPASSTDVSKKVIIFLITATLSDLMASHFLYRHIIVNNGNIVNTQRISDIRALSTVQFPSSY